VRDGLEDVLAGAVGASERVPEQIILAEAWRW